MATEPLDLLRQNLDAVRDELAQAMAAAQPVELDQTVQGRLSRMDAMQQQALPHRASEAADSPDRGGHRPLPGRQLRHLLPL